MDNINNLLTIVFQNQQYDLYFVFKFRKISKKCKEISEYWLTEILNQRFLWTIDVTQFKNLKKIMISHNITDHDLSQLKHLTYVYVFNNNSITNQGFKYLNLTTLILNDSACSVDGIQHMTNLKSLSLRNYYYIFDKDLQSLNLTDLDISFNNSITDEGIKHMTNLLSLNIMSNKIITGKSLQCLNLYKLNAADVYKLIDSDIQHMTNLRDLNIAHTKITDAGLKRLINLKLLNIRWNNNITCNGIKHLKLDKLYFDINSTMTHNQIIKLINEGIVIIRTV